MIWSSVKCWWVNCFHSSPILILSHVIPSGSEWLKTLVQSISTNLSDLVNRGHWDERGKVCGWSPCEKTWASFQSLDTSFILIQVIKTFIFTTKGNTTS